MMTDEVSSAFFYANSLGLKTIYEPDDVSLDYIDIICGGVTESRSGFYRTSLDWVAAEGRAILDSKTQPKNFMELAMRELGIDKMLNPDDAAALPWIPSGIDSQFVDYFESRISNFN